ncbi:MAG: hypothetical protein AB1467_02130 [Candidatus Diapherotrites archaeon]
MAGLTVKTNLFPYRMHLKEKEPLELTIEIRNDDVKPKLVSFELELPETVAIDKSGMTRIVQKNLDRMSPGETKKFLYSIYPSKKVDTGHWGGKLTVSEHYQDYNYILNNYSKDILVRIIE